MFSLKRWVAAAATLARQQFEALKGGASAPSGSATINLREGEPHVDSQGQVFEIAQEVAALPQKLLDHLWDQYRHNFRASPSQDS